MKKLFIENSAIIKAAFVFAIFCLGSVVLLSSDFMQTGPVEDFTATISRLAGAVLGIFDKSISTNGTMLQSPGFAIKIVNGCNGVFVTALLVSAIIATPASWKKKLSGIICGAAAIYVLNVTRAISLFLIGSYTSKKVFDIFHVYVWQTMVVFFVLAFFVGWLGGLSAEGRSGGKAGGGDDRPGGDTERISDPSMDGDSAVL